MKKLLLLMIAPLSILVSGCLTSEGPFFGSPENIIQDEKLIGTYRWEQSGSGYWTVGKWPEEDDRYEIVYSDGANCSMRFMGFLFKAGTNRFLNLMPTPQACDDLPANPPSMMAHLQSLAYQSMQMAVKVCSTTNGPAFSFMTQESFSVAQKKSPSLWISKLPMLTVPRMVSDPVRQHEFLVNFGGDTNIFPVPQVAKTEPPKAWTPPRVNLSSNAYERIRPQQATPVPRSRER